MARSNRIGVRGAAARTAVVAAVVLALPSLASARTEVLQWTHPDPASVADFRVFVGTAPGTYTSTLSVAGLTPNASGVYTFSISVPDTATVYVAVKAVNAAGASAFSNERVRTPSGDGGGTSPPPPPPPSPSIPPADDPVSGQALWSEGFDGAAAGTQVSGWVDTQKWASLAVDDALFGTLDLGGDLVLTTASADHDIHSHWTGSGASSWSSYELRGLVLEGTSTANVGVTAASRFTSSAQNYRLAAEGGAFAISGHPWDAATKSCLSQTTGVVPQAGTWYVFRFQVLPQFGSNLLRAKVWPHGTSEPSGWQAECNDSASSRPTAGTVGVWAAGGPVYWDDLQVIPVDATAGTPPGGPSLGAPGQPYLIQP